MTAKATITFTQAGVQPPVYVVTSLSEPPWEPLEMEAVKNTESTDIVFTRHFGNVSEGRYQYKIRIGEGHWVIDESKESATDEHGNRNNVLLVQYPTKSRPSDRRKDSTVDSSEFSQRSAPVPFVMVDKVADKEQPEYGDTEPSSLPNNAAKRAADAEPDFEKVHKEPVKSEHVEPPPAAHLSAESDDELEYDDEQAAPLFRHESFQADESSLRHVRPSMISTNFRPTATSPSRIDRSWGDRRKSELDHGNFLAHEVLDAHDDGEGTDEDDELNAAPLLPHESASLELSTSKSNSAPRFAHDSEDSDSDYGDDHDTPLLPHERRVSLSGSESAMDDGPLMLSRKSTRSRDDGPFSLSRQSTRGHENDYVKESFSNGRPGIFSRTNSSTLPHKMPQSDAEDENLHDPSLERFPTNRDQILERVASIGQQLPEDDALEDSIHSPVGSVFSQACSSVELAPVKSYISLASVPEAENSDEDAEGGDLDSLPSPVVMNFARSSSNDPGTSTPVNNKRADISKVADRVSSAHTQVSRGAESADDSTSSTLDFAAIPAKVLNPVGLGEKAADEPTSQLRQRQATKEIAGTFTVISSEDDEGGDQPKLSEDYVPRDVEKPDGPSLVNYMNDPKCAGATMFVVGIVITACYLFTFS